MKRCKILLGLTLSVFMLNIQGQQIPQYLDCVKLNHLYREACHNLYEYDVVPFGTFYQVLENKNT